MQRLLACLLVSTLGSTSATVQKLLLSFTKLVELYVWPSRRCCTPPPVLKIRKKLLSLISTLYQCNIFPCSLSMSCHVQFLIDKKKVTVSQTNLIFQGLCLWLCLTIRLLSDEKYLFEKNNGNAKKNNKQTKTTTTYIACAETQHLHCASTPYDIQKIFLYGSQALRGWQLTSVVCVHSKCKWGKSE